MRTRIQSFVKKPTTQRGSIAALIAIAAMLLVAVWPGTSVTPSSLGTTANQVQAAVTTESGSISKVSVEGREFNNKDHIFGVDVPKDTGEAVQPVQVFLTDSTGNAVSGTKVTVNGVEATTGPDGSITVPTKFATKEPISGPQSLEIKVGDTVWKQDVWVYRVGLDNSVAPAAFTREDAMKAVNLPSVQAAFQAVGLRAEDVIDVQQGKSTGEYMIGWSNGQVVAGGIIPVGQPVWVYVFRPGSPSAQAIASNGGSKPNAALALANAPTGSQAAVVNPACLNPTPVKGAIVVKKFVDANSDGKFNQNDAGQSGVTFTLSGGTTCVTDSNGFCFFDRLSAGTYVVTETVPSGWAATTPTSQSAVVQAGLVIQLFFGNRQVPTPTPCCAPVPTPTPTPFRLALVVNITVEPFSHTPNLNVQRTTVTASPTGGDGTYTYSWSVSSNATIVSGQGTGQIVLNVTGCSDLVITVTVSSGGSTVTQSTGAIKPGNCPVTSLTLTWSQGSWSAYNASSNSYSTTLTATASGGTQPYSWSWSNGASASSITVQVTAGQTASGSVTVRDSAGATQNQTWTVTVPFAPPPPSPTAPPGGTPPPPAPTVNITVGKTVSGSSCTYTLTATATPSGSYSYSWSNGASGTTVTITLSFGQSASLTVTVTNPSSPSSPAGTANWQDVCGSSGY